MPHATGALPSLVRGTLPNEQLSLPFMSTGAAAVTASAAVLACRLPDGQGGWRGNVPAVQQDGRACPGALSVSSHRDQDLMSGKWIRDVQGCQWRDQRSLVAGRGERGVLVPCVRRVGRGRRNAVRAVRDAAAVEWWRGSAPRCHRVRVGPVSASPGGGKECRRNEVRRLRRWHELWETVDRIAGQLD